MRRMSAKLSILCAWALMIGIIPMSSVRAQTDQRLDYWIAGYAMNGSRLAALSIVDAHSIVPTHDLLKRGTVWLFVSPHETNQMAGWAMETSYEFDCVQRSERFLGGTSFDQSGAQIGSGAESQNWRAIQAGALAEGAFNFVCSTTRPAEAIEIGNVTPQPAAQQMFAQPVFDPAHPLSPSTSK